MRRKRGNLLLTQKKSMMKRQEKSTSLFWWKGVNCWIINLKLVQSDKCVYEKYYLDINPGIIAMCNYFVTKFIMRKISEIETDTFRVTVMSVGQSNWIKKGWFKSVFLYIQDHSNG